MGKIHPKKKTEGKLCHRYCKKNARARARPEVVDYITAPRPLHTANKKPARENFAKLQMWQRTGHMNIAHRFFFS